MNKDFFRHNRQSLMNKIDSDLVVVAGNVSVQRSNDAAYAFAQEANFWYLTGINDAQWRLVIDGEKSWLIAPDIDEVHRIFDGGLSHSDAQEMSGVDEVISFQAGETLLATLLAAHKSVGSLGGDPHKEYYDFILNPGPVTLLEYLKKSSATIEDIRRPLAILRAIKQPTEIALMRQAIDVTIAGFERIKDNLDSYSYEYQIEADFTHAFVSAGALGHAYDPIVAAGKNACTLHYVKNQAKLNPGEFVLLDIGASVEGYAADISRTYAYGDISDRQRAVHGAVEQAHAAIIDLLRPGLAIAEYFTAVDDIMKRALTSLGLLHTESDYRKYFPHSISHGLGIDVHDSLGGPKEFQVGMVLTVEPGIYIPEEGIGVRIEDDIMITETGHENLSQKLPTSL